MQLYRQARQPFAPIAQRACPQPRTIPNFDEIAMHPVQLLQGMIASIEAPTENVRVVRIRTDRLMSFFPGQYAKLRFVGGLERAYSIASVDGDDLLEFHIRVTPGESPGSVTVGQLRVGDGLGVSGPHGTSYLRRSHDGPVICIAGGTGLAPILSILRSVLESGTAHPVHVYYGEKLETDLYASASLSELARRFPNLTAHIMVEAGEAGQGMRSGSVTDALLEDWREPNQLSGFHSYIGGSPAMACAVRDILMGMGIDEACVHSDALKAIAQEHRA